MKVFATTILFVCFAFFAVAHQVEAQDNTERARIELRKILDLGQNTLNNPNLTDQQRFELLREKSIHYADIDVIARVSIGRKARGLSADEQAQYMEALKMYLGASLAERMMIFSNPVFDVDDQRNVRTGVIFSSMASDKGKSVRIDWSMTKVEDEQPKIMDVIVAGASMLAAQRLEFDAILRKEGIEGLIRVLRDKGSESYASRSGSDVSDAH